MEIKTSTRPCWKCRQITTVIETNIRFLTDKEVGEEIREKYPFFFLDFSKESEEAYYMNHCEHCGERQGENLLFIERLLANHKKNKHEREERLTELKYAKLEKEIPKARRTTLDEFFK